MSESLTIPKFTNETEEADWWYEHRGDLERLFDEQAAAGTLRRTNLADFIRRRASTVILDEGDAALARKLAEDRGEPFELYVRRVMHNALLLEKSA